MSAAVRRWKPRSVLSPNEDETGAYVLFADIEALRDSVRLAWLMPVIDGEPDTVTGDRRALALGALLIRGMSGTALVDEAMRVCP